MKSGKATGQSGSLSETVKSVGESGVDMVSYLIKKNLVEGIILAE